MKDTQSAASLHLEYRTKVAREAETYNRLKTAYPLHSFRQCATAVWRFGVLAEVWGVIATKLSRDKKDYLNEWRSGHD